jgi:hypothetical protein
MTTLWGMAPLVMFLLLGSSSGQNDSLNPPAVPVPSSYFGLHVGYPDNQNPFAWPGDYVPFGSYRLWDTADVGWSYIQRVGPQTVERLQRSHGVVTVTTVEDNGMLPQSSDITVTITGATDPGFNGTFPVAAVSGPRSFTFSQQGPDASSIGGVELASDWTMLDGAVAKAGGRQLLYTFGAIPLWATRIKPAAVPIVSISHAGNVFTITTAGPHGFHFNSGQAQWVKLTATPHHFLDGIYLLTGIRDDRQLTFQASPSDMPQGIRGGEVQIFDRGGGADGHYVPRSRIPYSPSTAMEPDPALFRSFVRQVVSRYCGCTSASLPGARIQGYESWNEPNLTAERGSGASFFVPAQGRSVTSSAAAMVPLAEIVWDEVKGIDRSATVVSPSATGDLTMNGIGWVNAFLADGGGRYFDVLGYHFYVNQQPPEAMLPVIRQITLALQSHHLNKPIWDTEVGWGGNQTIPAEEGPGYVARTYLLNWAAGVRRVYWYQWDNQCWVKLRLTSGALAPPQCNDSRQLTGITPAANAYREVDQWMVNASLQQCTSQNDIWTCDLRSQEGKPEHILWSTAGITPFDIPQKWKSRRLIDLTGATGPAGGTVELGPSPVLLQ